MISSPGYNNRLKRLDRTDLQNLAGIRLREAKILLDNNEPDGAYYIAGYAVECGLKACVAKQTRQYKFPDKDLAQSAYTHEPAWSQELAKDGKNLSDNWDVVKDWAETSRYEAGRIPQEAGTCTGQLRTRCGYSDDVDQSFRSHADQRSEIQP